MLKAELKKPIAKKDFAMQIGELKEALKHRK